MERRDLELPTLQFHAYQRPSAVPHRERQTTGWRPLLNLLRRLRVRPREPRVDWGRAFPRPRRIGRLALGAGIAVVAVIFIGALRHRYREEEVSSGE
jgi:hypothetical protein